MTSSPPIQLGRHLVRAPLLFLLLVSPSALQAQDAETEEVVNDSITASDTERDRSVSHLEDSWIVQKGEGFSGQVRTRPITLHLRDESRPALRHRLFPATQVDGNAAIYYLKAMGFLEQNDARQAVSKLYQKWRDESLESGLADAKPGIWQKIPPEEIDLAQAKEFLTLHSFQSRELREAARRKHFDMDRRMEEVDDPIGYLLPEIQTMRQLARVQSLRLRVALAEDRVDDAIEILQQQFAHARHLGDEPFLVSNLVGIAIGSIAWNDTIYLMERDDAPNLYWALATMPKPLVPLDQSLMYERGFLYEQLRALREVDEEPKPVEYWNDFLDRLTPQFGYMSKELGFKGDSNDLEAVRQSIVAFIVASYPGAKLYLLEQEGIDPETIKKYPPAQVVFLAAVRYYDYMRDEMFKYWYLPYWQAPPKKPNPISQQIRDNEATYGPVTRPTNLFLPAVHAVRQAHARSLQTIALLQTVEAIRIYATRNDGRLPESLDDLPLPAGVEPHTGKPPQYSLKGDSAIIAGHPNPGLQYRFELTIAK